MTFRSLMASRPLFLVNKLQIIWNSSWLRRLLVWLFRSHRIQVNNCIELRPQLLVMVILYLSHPCQALSHCRVMANQPLQLLLFLVLFHSLRCLILLRCLCPRLQSRCLCHFCMIFLNVKVIYLIEGLVISYDTCWSLPMVDAVHDG